MDEYYKVPKECVYLVKIYSIISQTYLESKRNLVENASRQGCVIPNLKLEPDSAIMPLVAKTGTLIIGAGGKPAS